MTEDRNCEECAHKVEGKCEKWECEFEEENEYKKAVRVLHCPDAYGGIFGEAYGRAIDLAIKMLKKECEKDITQPDALHGDYGCPDCEALVITKENMEKEAALIPPVGGLIIRCWRCGRIIQIRRDA